MVTLNFHPSFRTYYFFNLLVKYSFNVDLGYLYTEQILYLHFCNSTTQPT
nr:MAG TPA: hypothetical protein [Caudoviricetes sp.]